MHGDEIEAQLQRAKLNQTERVSGPPVGPIPGTSVYPRWAVSPVTPAPEPVQNKTLTIRLKNGASFHATPDGELVITTEIPADELLYIYAWSEGTKYERGATSNPSTISFDFPTEILGAHETRGEA